MENSRFNDLSAELRNNIYELVVTSDEALKGPILAEEKQNWVAGALAYLGIAQPPKQKWTAGSLAVPGLAQTCKQMRDECLLMFYANNEFILAMDADEPGVHKGDLKRASAWIRAVPKACHALIPHVSIQIKPSCRGPNDCLKAIEPQSCQAWKALRDPFARRGYTDERLRAGLQQGPGSVFALENMSLGRMVAVAGFQRPEFQ